MNTVRFDWHKSGVPDHIQEPIIRSLYQVTLVLLGVFLDELIRGYLL